MAQHYLNALDDLFSNFTFEGFLMSENKSEHYHLDINNFNECSGEFTGHSFRNDALRASIIGWCSHYDALDSTNIVAVRFFETLALRQNTFPMVKLYSGTIYPQRDGATMEVYASQDGLPSCIHLDKKCRVQTELEDLCHRIRPPTDTLE